MELAAIINQYYDAFMMKHGDTALPVIMENGDLYRVVTAVVQSVRTMKPAYGLTDNRQNYYRFFIL